MDNLRSQGNERLHKELNVIVGGNGSGKSTFFYRFLNSRGLTFLNADELAKSKWADEPEKHSYEAAQEIGRMRQMLLATHQSFCFETVFSHTSKVDFLALAKSYGYTINLFVIHVGEDPTLNIARVANRKANGGHSVPDEKVISRIPRMLDNVKKAVPLCTTVSFYDNSSATHPFKPVAVLKVNETLLHITDMPKWASACIGNNYSTASPHVF